MDGEFACVKAFCCLNKKKRIFKYQMLCGIGNVT